MLNEFDSQCQELRTRIARSRRRLDRRARDLTHNVTQLFRFPPSRGGVPGSCGLACWPQDWHSRVGAKLRHSWIPGVVSFWARLWRAAWTSSRDDFA